MLTQLCTIQGGDPAAIPDLTFESFKAFHQRFYHPSNARFWFYGDDCFSTRLAKLNAYLDEFEAQDPQSKVEWQPLWKVSLDNTFILCLLTHMLFSVILRARVFLHRFLPARRERRSGSQANS
jgi:hypothetical protein